MKLRGIFEPQSNLFKLLLLIFFIAFIGSIAAATISSIALISMGLNINDAFILQDYTNYESLQWIKIIQTISSIFTFLVPALFTSYLISNHSLNFLHLRTKPALNQIILAVLLLIVTVPIINYLIELNGLIRLPDFFSSAEKWMQEKENIANELTEAILEMNGISDFLLNLFMIGVVAALAEEILFRGILQNIFTSISNNYHIGIWITAIIFSAIHLQFYGFIPRMLLGAAFGYLLVWSGTLWVPIIAHFFHNSLVVTISYIFEKFEIPINQETIGTEPGQAIYLIPSFVLCSFILFYFYKNKASQLIYAENKNGLANTDP